MEPLTTPDLFAADPPSRKRRSRRRVSTATWLRERYRPTDGPDAGKPLRLEKWQRDLLNAIDRERKPIVAIRAASQIGKTLLCLGVGTRAAVDGKGVLIASATETSIRDMSRRLEAVIEGSPDLARVFPSPRSGPGARASWKDRRLVGGGWMAMAASGSASQLASRTAAVGIADECSRWPQRVRSGEGHPLALLRARLLDWGDEGRLLAISSPVLPHDTISLLYRDGDRRRLEYPCPDCGARTALEWEMVTGRDHGEVPGLACPHCGVVHDEAARRRMLRGGRWTATREHPTDEDVASYTLSRLDSARATLVQITREWRRARLGAERGDPAALKAFRNTILGLPSESGAADVDRLYERRQERFDLREVEQITAGVDVQTDRLYFNVLAFSAHNRVVWVLASDVVIGDPREGATWEAL